MRIKRALLILTTSSLAIVCALVLVGFFYDRFERSLIRGYDTRFEKIESGQSTAAVRDILGSPHETVATYPAGHMFYVYRIRRFDYPVVTWSIQFDADGKVTLSHRNEGLGC